MIEGINFEYVTDDSDTEYVRIKLLDGPYVGVIYRYGKVGFSEIDGNLHLQFDFVVVESPVVKKNKLEKDKAFKQYIGDHLITIIQGNLEQEIIDETGTDDFKEFDLQ